MSDKQKPNIVVFMVDQMRAPGVGSPCHTPHLDQMATEGVTFTESVCPSPVCSPSRATFHTGLLPSHHRLYDNVHLSYADTDMDSHIPTLASVLKAQGYRTGQSGVWHVSATRPASDYGFDVVSGEEPMFSAGDAQPLRTISLPDDTVSGKDLLAAVYGDVEDAYSVDREVAQACSFIEDCARTPEQPFFLYVSTRIPHVPWKVTQNDLDKVPAEAVVLPESFSEDPNGERCGDRFPYNGRDYGYWKGTGDELRAALRCYYALIAKVDEQVGVLGDTLKRLGLDDNTLVIFTSDHGEMSGAHNLVGKGFDFYDEVLRVPLIMRWPNGIDAGRRIDQTVAFEDIMPTFCELAGADVPSRCYGQSCARLFREESVGSERDAVFVEQYSHVYPGYAIGLRSRDWLYALHLREGEQLYDRKKDPHEMTNLALDPTRREAVRGWRDRIVSFMRDVNHPLATRIATTVHFMNEQEDQGR